jgi:hypothetical protein
VSARHASRVAAVAGCALALLGMKDERFRYERSVECPPGFCAVELPDDVIAAARPGLPDVRLLGERGEIAFALEEQLFAPPDAVGFIDVGSVPGQETTGVIDRGQSPVLIDAIRITLQGDEPYLKPVVLEDSADRVAFRRIAQASIFRTSGATMTELRFAPNDRRYLRVRLDDRASEARSPVSAVLHPVAPAPLPERAVPVTLAPIPSGDDSIDRFTLELPHPNLTSVALELDVQDPVFTRRVRVFEKLVFRDRVSRRLAGEGTIARYLGRPAELRVPLSALAGTSLEVEVERAGTPLGVRRGTLHVRPKRLVFRTPDSGGVTLLYGSPDAPPPSSDLASALSGGLPKQLVPGTLGPASDRGARSRLPEPPRGPRVDASSFRNVRPITLPPSGSLAYLDLVGVPKGAASFVRIVDAEGRQVPFVLESEERRVTLPLHFSTEHEDGKTRLRVTGFSESEPIEALELRASAPAFFRRPLDVYELRGGERGPRTRVGLASALWEKRPEERNAEVRVPLGSPSEREIFVELDDGDNAPISLSGVSGEIARVRVDFLFRPGEPLRLLSDPVAGAAARYDLSLLEDALLREPALPARLPPLPVAAAPAAGGPEPQRRPWFWFVLAGAFLLVVLALLRALKPPAAT